MSVVGYMVDYTNCDTTLSEYMYHRRVLYPTIEAAHEAAKKIYQEKTSEPPEESNIAYSDEPCYVARYEINVDGYYSYIKIYKVYSS